MKTNSTYNMPITILYGEPGAGKTTMAIQLADQIIKATGGYENGGILVLDADNGAPAANDVEHITNISPEKYLRVVLEPGDHKYFGSIVSAFKKRVWDIGEEEFPIGVVVVDTIAKAGELLTDPLLKRRKDKWAYWRKAADAQNSLVHTPVLYGIPVIIVAHKDVISPAEIDESKQTGDIIDDLASLGVAQPTFLGRSAKKIVGDATVMAYIANANTVIDRRPARQAIVIAEPTQISGSVYADAKNRYGIIKNPREIVRKGRIGTWMKDIAEFAANATVSNDTIATAISNAKRAIKSAMEDAGLLEPGADKDTVSKTVRDVVPEDTIKALNSAKTPNDVSAALRAALEAVKQYTASFQEKE